MTKLNALTGGIVALALISVCVLLAPTAAQEPSRTITTTGVPLGGNTTAFRYYPVSDANTLYLIDTATGACWRMNHGAKGEWVLYAAPPKIDR